MTHLPATNDPGAALKARWTREAGRRLLGRRITGVRWMTAAEQQDCGWQHAAIVLLLDNGSAVWPMADDEGNDAGALYGIDPDGRHFTLPVIG
jgi:hypothetical protein